MAYRYASKFMEVVLCVIEACSCGSQVLKDSSFPGNMYYFCLEREFAVIAPSIGPLGTTP